MALKRYGEEFKITTGYRLMRDKTLKEKPVCERCREAPSEELYHIVPYDSGVDRMEVKELIFDRRNIMALCRKCYLEMEENRGVIVERKPRRERVKEEVNRAISRLFSDDKPEEKAPEL